MQQTFRTFSSYKTETNSISIEKQLPISFSLQPMKIIIFAFYFFEFDWIISNDLCSSLLILSSTWLMLSIDIFSYCILQLLDFCFNDFHFYVELLILFMYCSVNFRFLWVLTVHWNSLRGLFWIPCQRVHRSPSAWSTKWVSWQHLWAGGGGGCCQGL